MTDQIKTISAIRNELTHEAKEKISMQLKTTITAALAVVAGLFWQTAITDTIKAFIPVSGAWVYELAIALIVTIFGGIAVYYLTKTHDAPAKDKPTASDTPTKDKPAASK